MKKIIKKHKLLIIILLSFTTLITLLLLLLSQKGVAKKTIQKYSEPLQEPLTVNNKANSEITDTNTNQCKYPFYAMQLSTAASWSNNIAGELLSYIDRFPDLEERELKMFEEDKLIIKDCYEALAEWSPGNCPACNEGTDLDFRKDCHPKILESLESNDITLEYMSENPTTFNKTLVRTNLSNIENLINVYMDLDHDLALGGDDHLGGKCPALIIYDY